MRWLLAVCTTLALGAGVSAQLPDVYEPSRGFKLDEDAPSDRSFEALASTSDVWELRRFEFNMKDQLKFRINGSKVVFGHSDGVVMWAVVFADRGGKISTPYGGDGESISHVWLRFHPSRLGGLFPPRDFKGRQGDPEFLYKAHRVHRYKSEGRWESNGEFQVPPVDEMIIDIDTIEGSRRFFAVDFTAERVEYKTPFVSKAVPQLPELARGEARSVIQADAEIVEESFVPVTLTSGWDERKSHILKASTRVRGGEETAACLFNLVSPLGPGIEFRFEDETTTTYPHKSTLNAHFTGTKSIMGELLAAGPGARRSLTEHGVGYILLTSLKDRLHISGFDDCLDSVASSWALILDLRFLSDADEELARQLAGRFLVEGEHVYGQQLQRANAPFATGEPVDITFEARGPWTYEAPIHVLIGRRLSAGAENLALMLSSLPNVKTWGSPTSGTDLPGDWRPLPAGFELRAASKITLDLEGRTLRGFGLDPDEISPKEEKAFTSESDPVAYEVLDYVHRNAPPQRTPGRRDLAKEDTEGAE